MPATHHSSAPPTPPRTAAPPSSERSATAGPAAAERSSAKWSSPKQSPTEQSPPEQSAPEQSPTQQSPTEQAPTEQAPSGQSPPQRSSPERSAAGGGTAVGRIPVLDVRPVVLRGRRPAKAVAGETFQVSATVFREGHDAVAANVVLRDPDGRPGPWTPMRELAPGTDRWGADVTPDAPGHWTYTVEGWSDPVSTWRHHARIKIPAGIDTDLVLEEGALLYERAAAGIPEVEEAKATAGSTAQEGAAAQRNVLLAAVDALRDESRPAASRLAAALDPEVDAVLARHPVRELVTESESLPLQVERERALYGSWYEFFPRSEGTPERPHGTFRTAARRLPAIAAMGFDVVYLPPIHPIGTTFRKGRNNTLDPGPEDVGVPWAIGSPEGGHDAVHPDLGTIDDFAWFVQRAREQGLEIALDFALQCSPDHPWVREHPEWFHHRPDGTIAYAENPPKKYQDIYPIAFDADMDGLVAETLRVLRHWMSYGVRIFRVDNPHTKAVVFWERVIGEINRTDPDVIFLAEAFTRPAMMHTLAQIGFQQSYTYFTWRNSKAELTEYLTELTGEAASYMRPNFFPNTPDILHAQLQHGGRPAFEARAVLAATLSPSWGVYSGYELCENTPVKEGSEEYLDSEKYQLRPRDWEAAAREGRTIAPLITRLNEIRRAHPALRQLRNLHFHDADQDAVIAYSKRSGSNTVLVVVNLDPHHTQEATVSLDMPQLGLDWHESVPVRDELTGETYYWGRANYVRLEPGTRPAHVLTVLRPSTPQIGGSPTR
ncbi:alpha-1,4-glucan--maltose-1-phosphate maltosyltransferase [Streptomyces bobili]|uniref:alpha-1,4-glucan--maltose-1-phosphate maltosyltransferase n=1 Tax=Streptomyces bobili TaxID=67280 RepID=UPI003720BD8A